MIRKTRMYRRLWYVKRRRGTGVRLIIMLTLIIFILSMLAAYAQNKIIPYALAIMDIKARALITSTVTDIVNQEFGSNPSYEDVVMIEKDSLDRVTSIQTNVAKLNLLSARISEEIQAELSSGERNKIGIPLGTLLGNAIFSAEGPDVFVQFVSVGRVDTKFLSEFTEAGMNQTRHSILLQIRVMVGIAAPLVEKQNEITVDIPLAETIIVGNGTMTNRNVHN